MNPLTAVQIRRNRLRNGEWEISETHRRQVTDRICSLAASPSGRLCVLGAGNCNDIDLSALLAAFAEVHLVDLDRQALDRGIHRQLGLAPIGVHLHGGVDVTGVWGRLAQHAAAGDWPSIAGDDLALMAADPVVGELPGPFDVVVSTGMLSQLIEATVSTVPERLPGYWELLLAIRTGHLRLAARLAAPDGRGLLVTDFVSSASCAELGRVQDAQLEELAERLAGEANFFHGLNPVFLPGLYERDAVLRHLVAGVKHRGYWLWHQRARTYAVLAIEFRRNQSGSQGPC
jgi:hypothetical protein